MYYYLIGRLKAFEILDFNRRYILEKTIKLKKEISVILTRFGHQNYEVYEPIENYHENQILKRENYIIPNNIIINERDTLSMILQLKSDHDNLIFNYYFNDNPNLRTIENCKIIFGLKQH